MYLLILPQCFSRNPYTSTGIAVFILFTGYNIPWGDHSTLHNHFSVVRYPLFKIFTTMENAALNIFENVLVSQDFNFMGKVPKIGVTELEGIFGFDELLY